MKCAGEKASERTSVKSKGKQQAAFGGCRRSILCFARQSAQCNDVSLLNCSCFESHFYVYNAALSFSMMFVLESNASILMFFEQLQARNEPNTASFSTIKTMATARSCSLLISKQQTCAYADSARFSSHLECKRAMSVDESVVCRRAHRTTLQRTMTHKNPNRVFCDSNLKTRRNAKCR